MFCKNKRAHKLCGDLQKVLALLWIPFVKIIQHRLDSSHPILGVQSNRVCVVLEKAIEIAVKAFHFENAYLDYPNKVTTFHPILFTAARYKEINDPVLVRRWKKDQAQFLLAKVIVSPFLIGTLF